jgi:Ca2+/Na+ antiporter
MRKPKEVLKMINGFYKVFFYLFANVPLFLFASLNYPGEPLGAATISLTIVIILGFLILQFSAQSNSETSAKPFVATEPDTSKIFNYFIVYLFPFVLPENQIAAAISLIVLLIVVGYFYIETDLIFLNPMLYLFGYKVYKIYFEKEEPTENEEFQSAWLIASKLEKNMEVKELSKELYLGL